MPPSSPPVARDLPEAGSKAPPPTNSTSSPPQPARAFPSSTSPLNPLKLSALIPLAQLRHHGAAVLVSHHNFHATGDLQAILARMRPLRPDIYKIIPTATTLRDSLTALSFLHATSAHDPTPLIVLAMGEPGIPTRILGPSFGSAFTFAAATHAEATAPGQLTAETLTNLYRIPQIARATRIFGVAGDPIHSSLSPLMLNTAFRAADLDAVYIPLKTDSAEELFEAARILPLQGFSVTMPLKQAVLPFLDHLDPLAARIGAVNTVHRTPDGQWYGYNTDVAGIVLPLERRLALGNARILVSGRRRRRPCRRFRLLRARRSGINPDRTPAKAAQLAGASGATPTPSRRLGAQTL